MSSQVMGEVWKVIPALTPVQALVALALAERTDPDGVVVLAYAQVSEMTNIGERGVGKAVTQLVRMGLMDRISVGGYSRKASCRWKLPFSEPLQEVFPEHEGTPAVSGGEPSPPPPTASPPVAHVDPAARPEILKKRDPESQVASSSNTQNRRPSFVALHLVEGQDMGAAPPELGEGQASVVGKVADGPGEVPSAPSHQRHLLAAEGRDAWSYLMAKDPRWCTPEDGGQVPFSFVQKLITRYGQAAVSRAFAKALDVWRGIRAPMPWLEAMTQGEAEKDVHTD